MPSYASPRIALVTGASRGIGAEVARHLAHPETHVIVNYREKTDHANSVADAIRDAGGSASTAAADICDEAAVAAMIDDIGQRFGRLDTLVLNAAGGLVHGADSASAMRVNRAAQRRLAQLALELMPTGGHIVFVTSHQAHFYPNKAVPKGCAPLAASKRAGETTLQAMRSEFHRHGIHFTVVSGEMIDETFTPRWAQQREPAHARHSYAPLPTISEFAAAVATAATAPSPAGIVYVGGPDCLHRTSA
ncbi:MULTISPECIES: SDR family oxidoreductase [Mycolicibacterium]|uniref:Short chain dehydrogenase n=1 Tax=Mycolicibacterium mageritense TaxID=53462 RepID=A0AAI8XNP4_MYCME|nr:SDR family oxidoreductase [Mycolicibacterium mageritense]OKH80568.1 short-chain dehydrogenase [Mycobacterium sp. SWH-M3]MCC9184448.1 SDR family oxidoreductase [Mycolicibacterium mageritense]TXI63967.1 MAG: SDR family NAD(P)-dependent oxidoreductase [Mycolicibacterium mageritense]CDO23148.1 short chain dehydrogenase [Mycolicibacterium mageritense DSM 44476 = CIP 104973]BBX32310.1 short chain dehydrogenase [Mycolicibacterium mageritense]